MILSRFSKRLLSLCISAIIFLSVLLAIMLAVSCESVYADSTGIIFENDKVRYEVLSNPSDGENGTVSIVSDELNHNPILVIPETVQHKDKTYTVTEIASKAFQNCNTLESITIPATVSKIGNKAFAKTLLLETVVFEQGSELKLISESTFEGCKNLKSVLLPDSIVQIANAAFKGCTSIELLSFPESLTNIGNNSFDGCKRLESVTFHQDLSNIGGEAFIGCSALEAVDIYNDDIVIGGDAFSNCKIGFIIRANTGSNGESYAKSYSYIQFESINISNPDPDPIPEPDPAPNPPLSNGNGLKGNEPIPSDNLNNYDDILTAKTSETVSVDASKDAVVPSDIFSGFKGKDINLVLDLGNGMKWTINGKDIIENITVDLSVKADTNDIPSAAISEIISNGSQKQISLAHSGEFGFKAFLSVDLGSKYDRQYASLFYFNPATNKLEFQNDSLIVNGSANLEFTHASDYLIVIDPARFRKPNSDNSASNSVNITNTISQNPRTGDNSPVWSYSILALGAVLLLSSILLRRRQDNN